MKTETIFYHNGRFITEPNKHNNANFYKLTTGLVNGFGKLIRTKINADAGILSGEFIDHHPDTDELIITAKWRYYGLTNTEIDQVDAMFNDLMTDTVNNNNGLTVVSCGKS